jgi:hypothetical protein
LLFRLLFLLAMRIQNQPNKQMKTQRP